MVLGRTRQLDRSQIDALIRHAGYQIEAVDTGYAPGAKPLDVYVSGLV